MAKCLTFFGRKFHKWSAKTDENNFLLDLSLLVFSLTIRSHGCCFRERIFSPEALKTHSARTWCSFYSVLTFSVKSAAKDLGFRNQLFNAVTILSRTHWGWQGGATRSKWPCARGRVGSWCRCGTTRWRDRWGQAQRSVRWRALNCFLKRNGRSGGGKQKVSELGGQLRWGKSF